MNRIENWTWVEKIRIEKSIGDGKNKMYDFIGKRKRNLKQ